MYLCSRQSLMFTKHNPRVPFSYSIHARDQTEIAEETITSVAAIQSPLLVSLTP